MADLSAQATQNDSARATAAAFAALLKPRVMSLVVFTALIAMWMAPGGLHPVLGAAALLCIAVGAGASGAINMWYDADIDAVMLRTSRRPIPAGRVTPGEALGFGVLLSGLSVMAMGLFVNWLAAFLLAFTIAFYVFVYTMWLKRRTPQNIVIGGAAGALPPVVGWAAVTGQVDVLPLILFAIIFFWTPPHFWALSVYRAEDYERAGVPMLPVVAGVAETKRQILLYSVILAPLSVLPWPLGLAGPVYGLGAAALGGALIWCAWRVLRTEGDAAPRRLFKYSLLYLFLVFALLPVDRAVWG